MKKISILILLTLLPFVCNAQFVLKEDRFFAEDGKDYVVFSHPGMSKDEIFSRAKSAIMSMFVSPDNVMSENVGEMISVRGIIGQGAYMVVNAFGKRRYDVDVTLKVDMMFKDGRFRINAPQILDLQLSGKDSKVYLSRGGRMEGCIYDRQGNTRYPELIVSLEDCINKFVKSIDGSVGKEMDDEW